MERHYSEESKLYVSIINEDLEKQYSEESDWMYSFEDQPQPSSSHTNVPSDLEQFGAYTQSYQQIKPF